MRFDAITAKSLCPFDPKTEHAQHNAWMDQYMTGVFHAKTSKNWTPNSSSEMPEPR